MLKRKDKKTENKDGSGTPATELHSTPLFIQGPPSEIQSPYEDLLQSVLENGVPRDDRTGTGTIGVFGTQTRYNLAKSFPLVTTKKVFWKGIVAELIWMMRGMTNVGFLNDHGVDIWNEWANPATGDLGPVYGRQWRSWPLQDDVRAMGSGISRSKKTLDQLTKVINELKVNPFSRRLVVSAWNPAELDQMALQPCHTMFQFNSDGRYLDLQLYQRSGDLFLGVPFNIASYSLLTHIVAAMTGLEAREFIHTIGDAHIYVNHIEQVKEQLARDAKPFPTLAPIVKRDTVDAYDFKDFIITGYDPHPAIKADVSV